MHYLIRSDVARCSTIEDEGTSDRRHPDGALPLLHEPLRPDGIGRDDRATRALGVEDRRAQRDERVGHVVVG